MGRLRWTSEVDHLHEQCLRHDGKAFGMTARPDGQGVQAASCIRNVCRGMFRLKPHCCGENTSRGRNRKTLMRDRGNTIGDSGVFVFRWDQLCVPMSARVVSRLSRPWRGGDVKYYFRRDSEREGFCESWGGAGFSGRRRAGDMGGKQNFFLC